MKPILVALIAIATLVGAAWQASLAVDHLYLHKPVRVDDPRFPPHGPEIRSKPRANYPQTEAACNAQGGMWYRIGLSPSFGCQMKATDAGQACYDSRNCEGLCEADDDAPVGAQGPGRCSDRVVVVGCHNIVASWRAWPICYD